MTSSIVPLRAGLALAGSLGFALLAAGLASLHGAMPDALLWSSLATQGVWIGAAFGLAAFLEPEHPAARLGLGPVQLPARRLLALGLGLFALSNGLSALLSWIELRDTGTLAQIDELASGARGPSFLLLLLALGVGPGVGEELLFRGLAQGVLVRRFGAKAGIALAAAIFGAAHLDPVHSSAAFGLGLYLGLIAYLAGSVRASIFWHVANNCLALLGARLGPDWQVDPRALAALLLPVAAAIAGWAALIEGPSGIAKTRGAGLQKAPGNAEEDGRGTLSAEESRPDGDPGFGTPAG